MAPPPKTEIFEIELALWEMIIDALAKGVPKSEVREAWDHLYNTEWEVAFTCLVGLHRQKEHLPMEQMEFLYNRFYAGSVESLEQWLARTAPE